MKKKEKKSTLPDMGTYMPEPGNYDTFSKTMVKFDPKKKEKSSTKSKLFGSSERFYDPKKAKVKRPPNPGPGNYDMICDWSAKTTARSKEENKKDWMKNITKGV